MTQNNSMEIALNNYETALPKELLQQAKKNTVRECDETEKGRFVAYVDEGDDSFDVALTISKNIITEHTCDCKANMPFCRHKTALLLYIAEGKKTKVTVKAKKKSKSEVLLDEAEMTDLKEWVRDLLLKYKDIELSFIHYFSGKQQQYSPEEVTTLTNDAIKAVVGNKKNVDPTQLKKLVDLWTSIHTPIIRNYQENAADKKLFLNLHTILETSNAFQLKINTNSNRIPKYMENILEQTVETVNNIYKEESWYAAVGYFIEHIPQGRYHFRMHYLLHLKNLASISNEERKQKLIDRLADQYRQIHQDELLNSGQYTKAVFDIIEENNLFARYYDLFKPIRFHNDFNQKLIQNLIENDHLELAEEYCKQQIQGNYKEEYNLPYLEFLKEIYTIQKNEQGLAEVLTELFPRTFNFDDYLFIYNRMPEDEEKKKWRTRILARAKNALGNYNAKATEFYFKLMDYEKNYKKMIDAIDSYSPYRLISKYFEPMVLTDKVRLLNALINKGEGYFWSEEIEKDKENIPALFETALKHFTAQYLMTTINETESKKSYYRSSQFYQYIKKKLLPTGN